MLCCFNKRTLSAVDDSLPVFDLRNYKGYAKITSVYDGDTFNAAVILHGRVLKFKFRTLGYDSPEMKPSLGMINRDDHIHYARLARDLLCLLGMIIFILPDSPQTCLNKRLDLMIAPLM